MSARQGHLRPICSALGVQLRTICTFLDVQQAKSACGNLGSALMPSGLAATMILPPRFPRIYRFIRLYRSLKQAHCSLMSADDDSPLSPRDAFSPVAIGTAMGRRVRHRGSRPEAGLAVSAGPLACQRVRGVVGEEAHPVRVERQALAAVQHQVIVD